MFNKHFILLLINSYLCLSELIISPSDDIVINEGDPLEITCISSENIDFFYPKNITSLEVATSSVSVARELANGTSKFIFKRSKTIFGDSGWYGCIETSKNQPKLDLGIIYVTPDTCDKKDVKWTYVYVKSTEHLLVDMPFIYRDTKGTYNLIEEEGNDVLLPCRPTSTDYEVKFYSLPDNKLINQSEYDPKRGMVVKNIQKDGLLHYYCLAVENDRKKTERRDFIMKLTGETLTDKVPKFSSEKLTHMEIGKNFSIECLVRFWNHNQYFLDWITPRLTSRTSQKLNIIETYNFEDRILDNQIVSLELTIENVTSEDFGEYQCRLYEYASVVTGKINLQPHERKHLELSLQYSQNQYPIKSETSHTWRIDVDAYPIPKLHWFDPHGKEIVTSWNFYDYEVNGERFSVFLTKNYFTAEDSGTYTVVADNSEMKTISLNVVVYIPPKIIEEERQQTTYFINEVATFQCRATGEPKPHIIWKYLDEYQIAVESNFFTIIKSKFTFDKVISVAKTRISRSGYILCEARNKYDKDRNLIKINIKDPITRALDADSQSPETINDLMNVSISFTNRDNGLPETSSEVSASQFRNSDSKLGTADDKPKELTIDRDDSGDSLPKTDVEDPATGPKNPDGKDQTASTEPTKTTAKPVFRNDDPNRLGAVIKEMNVTEGSKITMECSASITEFPDDLKWYNATNLLKTDGRVAITETKAAPLHSSQLTISDVKEWDEGDYTCEGTIGGSTVKNHYHVHVNASALFSASIILQLLITLLSYFM